MMTKGYLTILFLTALIAVLFSGLYAQPADGENEYRLSAVNPRAVPGATDTLTADAGRSVWVADNPDLDNDGLPEIIVTEYTKGGRVFVYEVIGDDIMELVWTSKRLAEDRSGGQSTPRGITTGDFDNNGRQEIIFPVGFSATDTLQAADRGLYFYEFTGTDNDYGSEPVLHMTYESIDPNFGSVNLGRIENGLRVEDIDGDGKSEFLFAPREGNFNVANLYIMEVESGTLAGGDAVINMEYIYTDMAQALGVDGYVPYSTAIGDVDKNGTNEIIVGGWKNIGQGIGLGFIEIQGEDTYNPGSIIPITDEAICCVKYKPLFIVVNGEPAIYIHRTSNTFDKTWVVEGIVSYQFVSESNVTELFEGIGKYSIWDMGDQDHPTNSDGDGFDIYLSGGSRMFDIEYKGSGNLTDPDSYEITQFYDLRDAYDNLGGLFDEVFTRPGMDLDRDGLRDIVASYKGSSIDTLKGESLARNGFHIFFWEWGDSTTSITPGDTIPVAINSPRVITPDNYQLAQNYPNPFNPTTTIEFVLPINKTISLKIFNTLGQEVRTLIDNEPYSAGTHTMQWDGRDNSGNRVASGMYIYKLIFGNFSKSKKMTLVR